MMSFETANTTISLWDMFYLGNPHRHMYKDIKHLPHIYAQAWPYFLTMLVLENGLRLWQRKEILRLNDSITSISHAILQECAKLFYRGSEHCLYFWIYNNYKICELPWNSVAFWYFSAIAVDFCYYWMHRASHEIHIFWAQHQVHHSSEEFNVTVGIRQSVFQSLVGIVCYAPLALFVPPVLLLVHQQLSLLYQIWIHTETISTIGPLDYVLNTPAYHRVHHGSNLYCLDKNYGGVLIIWDRIFGTFQDFYPDKPITYGLVYQKNAFNPLSLQFFYNLNLYYKWNSMNGWKNKLRSVIKGPSWVPGLSWTGHDGRRASVSGRRKKYDVKISYALKSYLLVHFIAVVNGYFTLTTIPHSEINFTCKAISTFYVVWSLTSIGLMFEKSSWSKCFECSRCLTMFVHLIYLEPQSFLSALTVVVYQLLMGTSVVIWAVSCFVR
ncbi:alkylglycerol monooxygenase-like [Aphis gossypii]|uniref:alkylglycerol monooxygenase-like n=1 Tax=Aphis gossypii TaxID=80765 RepID=UPI00100EAF99|nr:alkylglycerol monooxygenase-like [Aphis gossypii]